MTGNGKVFTKWVELAPGQTLLTEVCNNRTRHSGDFGSLWNSTKDLSSGPVGVTLKSDALPGSFTAFALMRHMKDNTRFFSSVPFTDPEMVQSPSTVFVGVPVGPSVFLSEGVYVPQLSVMNFGTNNVEARVQYAESSEENANLRDVVAVNVPAMSSKEILLSGLQGSPNLKNSFIVTSNARPGELLSKLVARSDGELHEVELLGKDAMDPENGGNHPLSLENGTRSVLLLFNNDQQVQSFSVAIAGAKVVWRKTYKLQPMQTKVIDIGALAAHKVRDDHGLMFPADLLDGEVFWVSTNGRGRGRILQSNPATGLARSFSCGIFAAPCSPATLDLIPSTIAVAGQSTADFSYTVCGAPDQYSCTGPPTSGSNFSVSWTSQNTNIANAGGGGNIGTVNGYGAGTTEIIATAVNNFGTCSVGAGADVTVMQPYQVEPVATQNQGAATCSAGFHGWSRTVTNQLQTSTGTAIPYASMTMADTLTVVTPNSLGISGTVTGSDTTDSNGDWKDTYFVCSSACPGSGTASATQSWTYNGKNLAHSNTVSYKCTSITIDGR